MDKLAHMRGRIAASNHWPRVVPLKVCAVSWCAGYDAETAAPAIEREMSAPIYFGPLGTAARAYPMRLRRSGAEVLAVGLAASDARATARGDGV
jgi:hypothetical protein